MSEAIPTRTPRSDHEKLLGHLFYERLAFARTHTHSGRLLISVGLGGLFLLASIRPGISPVVEQSYWMLAVMIASTMFTLLLATDRLRLLLRQMLARVRSLPTAARDTPGFILFAQHRLTDLNMLVAGSVFGLANLGCGYLFGLDGIRTNAILLNGYLLTGFICGMAAYGIVVVIGCVHRYTQEYELPFDETHPDGCGGMAGIGSAIGLFAIVTLVMGIQIAAYILITDWSNRTTSSFVQLAIFGWAVYPFIMSLLVLIAPLSSLHGDAVAYKERREHELADELASLRAQLNMEHNMDADTRELTLTRISKLEQRRQQVHSMNAWPYSVQMRINYLLTIIPSVAVAASSLGDIRAEIGQQFGSEGETVHHVSMPTE